MKKILTMKKVTKTFGSGHTKVSALKAIDFYVKEGEFVSIIGPSGSGKSTFLTISGGLQTPTSGEIVINGPKNFVATNETRPLDYVCPRRDEQICASIDNKRRVYALHTRAFF